MPLRAALFDVGDTLVEHWAPHDVIVARTRDQLAEALGELEWIEELADADVEPAESKGLWPFVPEHARQETLRWYEAWFRARGIALDGHDVDRIRDLLALPLEEISTPVPGAFDAVRWCAEHGLRVVLVTNTLARDDAGVIEDWERFGLRDAIHGVVSSHTLGWRKPHPAIFERALKIAEARPEEAFHVGDNLVADVWGAKQLGLRAIWRRMPQPAVDAATAAWTHRSTAPSSPAATPQGDRPPVDVEPDAIVADLTEVPRIVERWLEAMAEGDAA